MEGNSLKTIENLCKIFETRIKLDKEKSIDTPEEVISNYEKYSKKIDEIYNEKFEKEIKKLIASEDTLEKEEKRLSRLIELLNKRLDERDKLENKFYKTTGNYIKGLQLIVSKNEYDSKKRRLEAITKYLDTTNEIETINESIDKLKTSLNEENAKAEEYEKKNRIVEEELYSNFKEVIKKDDYLSVLNEDTIDIEIDNILDKVNENKETLDVTKDSVSSLVSIGNDDDYSTYIEDAERNYYLWKNRELLLRIYKIVSNFEDDFSSIFEKRIELSKIIKNRKSIINSLCYEVQDELFDFENVVENDLNILKVEKEVLENITNYNNRITFKEERLNELNDINNSEEILAILREYNLIDTYDNTELYDDNNIELEDDTDNIKEEVEEYAIPEVEENIIKEFYDPYRIVEVKDYPRTLNIGLARLKGESVRDKVNRKLNPEPVGPTFAEINNDIENKKISSDLEIKPIDNEETTVENKEEEIPVWGNDSIEKVNEIPTWEDNFVEKVDEIPVWGNSSIKKEDETPVWGNDSVKKEESVLWKLPEIEPIKENVPVWDEPKVEEKQLKVEQIPDNSFWNPIDSNVSNGFDFPSINIPVNTNGNNYDDFGFPEINN